MAVDNEWIPVENQPKESGVYTVKNKNNDEYMALWVMKMNLQKDWVCYGEREKPTHYKNKPHQE